MKIKKLTIEDLLIEVLELTMKYIPASRMLELAIKYVPVPSREEFEASKSLTILEQNRWDRKYWAAWQIQRLKEIL